jgi:hypothetical protein
LGHKELFEGLLDIYEKWNWQNNKIPVIKLDFSSCITNSFNNDLINQLIDVGKEYSVSFENIKLELGGIFRHLVLEICALNASEEKNLALLITFLQIVKTLSPCLSLVTGSSRLARSGVFSGDNTRIDISFFSEFNALCGFTASEIKKALGFVLKELDFDGLRSGTTVILSMDVRAFIILFR